MGKSIKKSKEAKKEDGMNLQTEPKSPDDLLTVNDVCQMFQVTATCLWLWRRADKFPKAIKLPSGALRWKRSTIEEYLNNQQTTSF